MGQSLTQELGLNEPQACGAGSSQQANQFKAAVQAGISKIDTCLQYTVAHAEKEKHAALDSKRAGVYSAYQNALGAIDPNDESTAQGPINEVLGSVNALVSESTQLKQETETALNAWQAQEQACADAVTQVEALEDWEDEYAPTFRNDLNSIQNYVNERKWDAASKTCDALLPKLKPVYEEYEKQKAAKENYDAILSGIQAQLNDVADAEPNDQICLDMHSKIVESKGEMEAAVEKKDYVTAECCADELAGLLDQYQQAQKDFRDKIKSLEAMLNEKDLLRINLDLQIKNLEALLKQQKGEVQKAQKEYDRAEHRVYQDELAGDGSIPDQWPSPPGGEAPPLARLERALAHRERRKERDAAQATLTTAQSESGRIERELQEKEAERDQLNFEIEQLRQEVKALCEGGPGPVWP